MPFNLFKKPSVSKRPVQDALNSTIFPSPLTTQTMVASILQRQHPSSLDRISPADVQQFLTELYGYEASLHWTWIGCTFHPDSVKRAFERLPKDHRDIPGRSQRKALIEFVQKTQSDEQERKGRYYNKQGWDAGNMYVEGEKRRKGQEIQDLEKIMWLRLNKEPTYLKVVQTDGYPVVWYDSEP
ncbi:MAG: hypothetical protein Q9218_003579 [Villophora microphyllina]